MIEYQDAVQNPAQAFIDPELRDGSIQTNNLGLPLVMSGGFALTYTVTTRGKKRAVRCFHREIASIEQKYIAISKKLQSLKSQYFINFDFQAKGIRVRQAIYPIVRMDWVEGAPLGVWLDNNVKDTEALRRAKTDFASIARYLESQGIAHGDIQNGNVMMSATGPKLIDYDGIFVPGMAVGSGSEVGHRHFQHPQRRESHFGPQVDRFSFIVLDLSLQAVIDDKTLYSKFRDGGETIIFTANDFADPQNSKIFQILLAKNKFADQARNFAAICTADISEVPTLEDFLAGKKIPQAKVRIASLPPTKVPPTPVGYISAFPVVDALDFSAAERRVGDKIELVGRIVEVKHGVSRRGKGKGKPYVFINFGPWKGSIVKISVWSEGLAKLKQQPSTDWVGRWISVTGLLEPPYKSHRYGYTHLSITVQEDGQIQELDEAQARLRLTSVGKIRTSPTLKPTKTSIVTPTGPLPPPLKTGSTNRDILKRYTGGTQAQPQPTPAYPSGRTSTTTTVSHSKPFFDRAPRWFWIAASIAAFLWVIGAFDSKQPKSPPSPKPQQKPTVATAPSKGSDPPPRMPRPFEEPKPSPRQGTEQPTNRPVDTVESKPNQQPGRIEKPESPDTKAAPSLPPPIEIPTPKIDQPSDTAASGVFSLLSLTQKDDAQRVQARLSVLGYYAGAIDGVWSPRSDQALLKFRRTNGLGTDATLDQRTQSRLFDKTAIYAFTFVGGWATSISDCITETPGRAPTTITTKRAEAFGVTCDFLSTTQDGGAAWQVRAKCTDDEKFWLANIRLTVNSDRLTWTSEKGQTTYVRCKGAKR